jgi:hypothetical protein
MDNLFRDVFRLNLITQMHIGQERFSVATYFQDFAHYYFSKFVVNIRHAFKDFVVSEIKDFNARHQNKITSLVKYPALKLDKTIVPIPRGMINSYKSTLTQLTEILGVVHAPTIQRDLNEILTAMGTGKLKTLRIDQLSKEQFEDAKVVISKLFGKTGLSHSTVSHSLVSPEEIGHVNQELLQLTSTYYPAALAIDPLLKKIETRFSQLKFNDTDKDVLSALLMTMAYRLSLMAVVVEHLQEIEHGFIGGATIILKQL